MRPRILSHIIDNESKSETLGFLIFVIGAVRVLKNPSGDANDFLWAVVFSSILVGGKMVSKSILEALEMKLNGAAPAPVKEAAKDGPQAPA